MEHMKHEQVVHCYDAKTGLRALIAIHSTILGPALGGTRMWMYAHEQEALQDVLRLSEGMTYKASVAGLDLGGGKAVIIGDSRRDKSPDLMRKYGEFVERLNGHYITAEDVGTTKADMAYIGECTRHVTGRPENEGGSGDPSPVTAYGVYRGMKAAAMKAWDTPDLGGRTVVVQGAGNVGRYLTGHLLSEGARVRVCDVFADQIERIRAEFPQVQVISPESIYQDEADIYAPCALGATLNDHTIPELRCRVVAGGANNQLADVALHAQMLTERGIVYAPDFLINSGGLINVYSEIKGYTREEAIERTTAIYDQTLRILELADELGVTTHEAAVRTALTRIDSKVELATA
ncbi:MAG: Glu/Leu/Phe/Val dehydrogenase [Sphingomonadales bacterium]|nr:Glu/Leu/Phe/Val dehydrogenase [Sphingomonadales bacterium]